MKIVIVGCGSGIGKFLAEKLETDGHEVFRVSRSVIGPNSHRADVTSLVQLSMAVHIIMEKWDTVDGLVYCAGKQGPIGPAVNLSPDQFSSVFATNFTGFFNTFLAFYQAGLLVKGTGGRKKIAAFSGGGATGARPNLSAYSVSKTALVRMVENLAIENPDLDINTIAPGMLLTGMTHEVIAAGPELAGEKEYREASALQHEPAKWDKLLDLVRFLLTPESDGISGRLIAAQWDNWPDFPRDAESGRLRRTPPQA